MENSLELRRDNSIQQSGGMMEVASSRQAQEVQAAMVIAQRFPRDTNKAYLKIMNDCKRKSLAAVATYSYPRGGEVVSGPSIRIAETVAKAYGNLDFGVIELDRKSGIGNLPGESTMMAYCWDLETNVRSTKVFSVSHKRNTKKGSYNLTDERDIYEIAANQGSRRLRACILNIVPKDIVDEAVEACRKTMIASESQTPVSDLARTMLLFFKDKYGVTQTQIEGYLGHKIDSITREEIEDLRGVINSLKDGTNKKEDFFEPDSEVKPIPKEAVPESAKPKNFAPQSKEEAKAKAAEINAKLDAEALENAKKSPPAEESEVIDASYTVTEEAPPEISPAKRRANLLLDIQEHLKMLKMSPAEFNELTFSLTKKEQRKDLTNEDLDGLLDVLKIKLAEKE